MPESIFVVFLISTFAGYPVGIKTLSEMLDRGEIDTSTAEKAACFCYCGGPAFYSGAIGLTVFGSAKVGTLIFLSVLLSNLVIAFITCRFSELAVKKTIHIHKKDSFLVGGITSAGKSMGVICMTVIFFSAVMAVLKASGIFGIIRHFFGFSYNESALLSAFFEITSLSELQGSPYRILPIICAACSFGGICIIMQLFALKSDKLSLFRFIKLRPFAALLSALFCKILQPHLINEAVTAVSCSYNFVKVNNLSASLCLILMIFLLNYKKGLVFSD
ncbi:nucleoside recognition protein [Ruminococcus albus]|nr:nucleoside recognition protein [Ruminococcus albus]